MIDRARARAPRAGRVKPRAALTAVARGAYDSARMVPPSSRARRPRPASTAVVDLGQARDARKLRDLRDRCDRVDEVNRKALARLFQTGLIFSRSGARLGRDLLLAHQHLLRVSDLLARIAELPDASAAGDASDLYEEAHALLARTSDLTARCGLVLARGQ